jgi:hypothetical protein
MEVSLRVQYYQELKKLSDLNCFKLEILTYIIVKNFSIKLANQAFLDDS